MSLKQFIAGAALCALAGASQAASFNFSGQISFHNDVVQIPFTLDADATDVRVWTDSFLDGANFDPITAVWRNGAMVGQNDDDAHIAPGQTVFDSGLTFATLPAGHYLFTIATFNNFANSHTLADGFKFDHDTPVPLASWCQPVSHCDMGHNWSVHLDGVSSATPPPVPEPASYAMLLAGLGMLGRAARRRAGR
ncbi:MAG: DVUA0089 family protein [Pseudomonadota bacterium]